MRNLRTHTAGLGLALSLAGLPACGSSAGSAPFESTVDLNDGNVMRPGKGFDSNAASTRGFCVKPTDLTPIQGSSNAQKVSFEMREIDSYESLKQSLSITAAGAFSTGVYGGSGKASYFSSSNVNSYSTFMMVHVQVTNETRAMTSYSLTDDALRLKSDKAKFFQLCGDRFVSGVTTGGEFFSVVEFRSRTEEQRKEVSAKIRGHSGAWSMSGSFQSSMEYFSSFVETDIKIFRVGGSGEPPQIDGVTKSIGSLIGYATQFPAIVAASSGNAYAYTATIEDYGVVPNYLETPLDMQIQKQILDQLAEDKFRANMMRSRATYVLANTDQFSGIDSGSMQTTVDKGAAIINTLNAAASQCFNHPLEPHGCELPVGLTWPSPTWPQRAAGFTSSELCAKELDYLRANGRLDQGMYDSMRAADLAPQYRDASSRASGTVGFGACSDVGPLLAYLWR